LSGKIAFLQDDHRETRKLGLEAIGKLRQQESGTTFRGSSTLGLIAQVVSNAAERRRLPIKAKTILAFDHAGHDYLEFCDRAIEAYLRARVASAGQPATTGMEQVCLPGGAYFGTHTLSSTLVYPEA
jgi:hypothetical protein